MREAIEQFRAAIYSAGLNPPEVIEPNGRLHRFASSGKPSDDAGWYVFHDDGIPAGAFGDWRGGLSETWRADIGRKLSPQEEAAHRARVEAMRREREAEDAKRKGEAREKAAVIWQAAETAPEADIDVLNCHFLLALRSIFLECRDLHRERPGELVEGSFGAILLRDILNMGEAARECHCRVVDCRHLGGEHGLDLIAGLYAFHD